MASGTFSNSAHLPMITAIEMSSADLLAPARRRNTDESSALRRLTSLATLRATSRAEKPSARGRSPWQRAGGAAMSSQSISRIFSLMIFRTWKQSWTHSDGDPLTNCTENEKRPSLFRYHATSEPFQRCAAQGRNRFARLPDHHGSAQRFDRQKTRAVGGRSLRSELYRQRRPGGLNSSDAKGRRLRGQIHAGRAAGNCALDFRDLTARSGFSNFSGRRCRAGWVAHASRVLARRVSV